MATVKEINHDSSTTLSDFYSTISDPDGAVTVTVGAALASSTNGVEMDFEAGNSNPSLFEPFTFSATELRFRFRVNINTLANSVLSRNVLQVQLWSTTDNAWLFNLFIQAKANGDIDLLLDNKQDGGSGSVNVKTLVVGDNCIELRAIRETTAIAADGEYEVFVNGVSERSVSTLENFNTWNQVIDEIRVVFTSDSADILGILYYDECILTDANAVAICPSFSGYDLVLGGGQP